MIICEIMKIFYVNFQIYDRTPSYTFSLNKVILEA